MKLTTEYLIIIEKNVSEAFYHLCDSVTEFNKLLQTDLDIVIENSQRIKYKQNLTVAYEVKTGKVEGKEQRFFPVRLTFDSEESNLEEYIAPLRSLRGIGGNQKRLSR
jgi:hypothetical protein